MWYCDSVWQAAEQYWCSNSPRVCQVEEVREVMENEMRTQLRRQAAAHTDHLRDVLKIQEQDLKVEFEQVREKCLQGN